MRTIAAAVAIVLTASIAAASSIKIAVRKSAVEGSRPDRLLLVAFADEPVIAEVNLSWPDGAKDSEFARLDPERWWQSLKWTLRNTSSGATQTLKPRSIDVVNASRNPIIQGTTAHLGGEFRIGKLPVGNYQLSVSSGTVTASDRFAIRKGDETPPIRDEYLRRKAEMTRDYEAFRKMQIERTTISPGRADAWIALATRALDDGTEAEAKESYDKVVGVLEKNAADLARKRPKQAKEIRKRVAGAVANIRALQAQLPYYFANRERLQIAEESVDGTVRYVLKERKSGRVERVIVPEAN